MSNKSEAQIMQRWGRHKHPLASIICITYNHENYIREALEGFLLQETTFPFEIVIHDDASTDATPSIITEYLKRYPNLIRPVFQTVNQYSLGKRIFLITAAYTKGKYLALCQGDDFWIDRHKLQVQVEEMRKHPNCGLSFHPGVYRWADGRRPDAIFGRHCSSNKLFTTREVILGGGGFCLTPSLMVKKELFDNLPDWFSGVQAADYLLQVLAAHPGGALYLNRVMSVYRACTPNSWFEKVTHDEKYAEGFYNNLLQALGFADQHFDFVYHQAFLSHRKSICKGMCHMQVFSKATRKRTYERFKHELGWKDKLAWYLIYSHTPLCEGLRWVKRHILKK